MRVLIVEDDSMTAAVLERAMREEDDEVVVERDGLTSVSIALSQPFDVIVLDVMLPGLDGFGVVHRLRDQGCETPILMLTARSTNWDLIQGLNAGADDYLAKPFALDVFFARLRALGRRGRATTSSVIKAGNLSVDIARREVVRAGRSLQLTRTEYDLLELLIKNAGRNVPREQIIESVWGSDSELGKTNLDTFVHLLRTKVDSPGEVKLIRTVRGVGYTLRVS